MNWPFIRAALISVISGVTGIAVRNVVWKGSVQENSIVVGARAVLSTNSVVTIGVDETRREDDIDPANDQLVNRCGQRRFTWTIQIEADDTGVNSITARDYIDRVRIRLQRESALAQLNSAGLALQNFQGTTHKDFLSGGRMVSWAVMDVSMVAVANDTDDTIGAGGFIGEVDYSGTVKDSDGSTVGTISDKAEG